MHDAKLNASTQMSDSSFVPAFFVRGVGLFVFFTVRALIRISYHIVVQTREGSLYSWSSSLASEPSTPQPGMIWLREVTQSTKSVSTRTLQSSSPCIFGVLLKKMHLFQQGIKTTPILLTKSFCWLRFIKIPEIPSASLERFHSHTLVVHSISFLSFYPWFHLDGWIG